MYNGTICTHTHSQTHTQSHFKNVILIISVDVKLAHKPMTTYTYTQVCLHTDTNAFTRTLRHTDGFKSGRNAHIISIVGP